MLNKIIYSEVLSKRKLMFSELLSHSGEKIFIQAIDQFFELQIQSEGEESNSFPSANASPVKSAESAIEASLENLNVKFCESLDSIENDNSTEVDSEESLSTDLSSRKTLCSTDIFNISSDVVSKETQKIKSYYIQQIEVVNKIKAIFFQEKPKSDTEKLINNNVKNL